MYESYSSDLQSLIKNRVAAIPFNSNLMKSIYLNEILTQTNLIGISSLNRLNSADDNSTYLEQYLHDLGIVSVVTSSSFSSAKESQVGLIF